MKVKELIELLKGLDGEMDIITYDTDHGCDCPEISKVKIVQSRGIDDIICFGDDGYGDVEAEEVYCL
jgi:hypothetical protein